jgi:hypothetical protein
MKKLNFSTVENLIFYDQKAQAVLPPYMLSYVEQWKIAKRIPALSQMGKQSMLNFLNNLKEDHVDSLEEYFGERVVVESMNYQIVENIKIPLAESEEVCRILCDTEGFNYFATWRDADYLYISFWR